MANIFISYRRSDSAPYAGRLYDRLIAHFSESQVFMDLEIKAGDDFVERLEEGVSQCEVLLVLIGPTWLDATDEVGKRRLDDPDDYARIEVAAALKRPIRVIPVLVGDAVMPRVRDLPENLVPLARRQAMELSDLRFRTDADALIAVIEEELEARAGAKAEDGRTKPAANRRRRLVVAGLGVGCVIALIVVVLVSSDSGGASSTSVEIVETGGHLRFAAESYPLQVSPHTEITVKNQASAVRVRATGFDGDPCQMDLCDLASGDEMVVTTGSEDGRLTLPDGKTLSVNVQ